MPTHLPVNARKAANTLAVIQHDLAVRILALTDNGDEIISFFHNTMRDPSINMKFRIACAQWLADRAWGKAPEHIHINAGGIFETLAEATEDELRRIIEGDSSLPMLRAKVVAGVAGMVERGPDVASSCSDGASET